MQLIIFLPCNIKYVDDFVNHVCYNLYTYNILSLYISLDVLIIVLLKFKHYATGLLYHSISATYVVRMYSFPITPYPPYKMFLL